MNKNKSGNMGTTDLATIDNLEISPLGDEELDAVAGGIFDTTTTASCSCCVSGATNHK